MSESRMLFRMIYQPCDGRCYAPDEVLGIKGLGLNVEQTADLLSKIVRIHEPACGRKEISYAFDYNEENDIYIGIFTRFGEISTYASKDPVKCLNNLIDGALNWYYTDHAKQLLSENPGDGKDVCEHGNDSDLIKFALKYSGLSNKEINILSKEINI